MGTQAGQAFRDFDFHFFVGVFVKHYRWIFAFALLGGILALGISMVLPKRYAASATLLIWPRGNHIDENGSVSDPQDIARNTTAFYQQMLTINYLVTDFQSLLASRSFKERVEKQIALTGRELAPYTVRPSLLRERRYLEVAAMSTSPETAVTVANEMTAVLAEYVEANLPIYRPLPVDKAILPEEPYSPRTPLNVAAGICLGLFASFGAFLLKEIFFATVDAPAIAESRLGASVLGGIVRAPGEAKEAPADPASDIVTVPMEGKTPRFDIAEGFRLLRNNLQYAFPRKSGAKVFVVTSTAPRDGKTFVASNTAVVFASAGRRVLLMNCDLRKPSLSRGFKLNYLTGMVNILTGDRSFGEVLNKNVLGLPLDVLAGGPVPPNPSELLLSDEFARFLEEQRKNYDCIIIDAPPCLNIPDAAIAGKLSDGVIFVVNAGKTRVEAAHHALNQLRALKIPLLGVVLNRYTPPGWGDSYGYGAYGEKQ